MSGGMIGPEYDGQIRQTIRAVRNMGRTSSEMDLSAQERAASRFSNKQAILLDDLAAAVNTKRDPSTARAAVLRRKASGDLTQTALILTVTNRFKNISVNAGTYIKIEHIDGEWQPYAADCASEESSGSV
jgi:multidrug resistance efflux pump